MPKSDIKQITMFSQNQKVSLIGSISVMILGIALILNVFGIPKDEEFYPRVVGAILTIAPLTLSLLLFIKPVQNWFKNLIFIDRTLKEINNEKLQSNMYEYTENTITTIANIIDNLNTGPTELDKVQIKRLMKIMFKTKATYVGIDYNLPSNFYAVYPDYLEAHRSSLDGRIGDARGYRIMAMTPEQLKEDSTNEQFAEFYDWHLRNSVGLNMVTPTAITTKLADVGLGPERCDNGIACWRGEFAILFAKTGTRGVAKVEILDNSNEDFKKIESLFSQLEQGMETIDEHGAYKTISSNLAMQWSNYVIPNERWHDIREFLYNFLDKYKGKNTIIDAAAGIGIEYQNMMADGYSMDANEYQDELVEAGKKYALEHQYEIEYEPTRHDWRVMLKFGMRNKYGAVLLIGNSLRVLSEKGGQQKSVEVFYEMLQEGGTLIIDERNYQHIIDGHETVRSCMGNKDSSPMFNNLLALSNRPSPMYHGTSIKSLPTAVNPEEKSIQFTYYDTTQEKIINMTSVMKNRMHDWEFFHYVDMETLLINAGFKTVKKYADYKLTQEVTGDNYNDASMYVYVAEK